MIGATFLTEIVTLASAVSSLFGGDSQTLLSESRPSFSKACQEIASSISPASNVYDPNSAKYLEDIFHWTSSSSQYAACSLEPGTAEDIGVALRILGRTRTPFAVKGGGHATNPEFSSTEGVQIAMTRFDEVVYDSKTQTATIGAGLTWDAVYAVLEPYGVNVAGGRIAGVGVAGFVFNSVSVTSYPTHFIQYLVNETHHWSKHLPDDVFGISYDVQPFLPSLFDHNTTPTAYPPSRAQPLYPFNFHFSWRDPKSDQAVYDATRTTAKTLRMLAKQDDQGNAARTVVYPNYGIFDTPLDHLYGEHVPRLQAIKVTVDPENVMGLAGGFKI
ncbi:hypothetical protein JVU11DRAFT_12250 [Chiua virens]|nr:hypothetical protein JVU11DRAFT_12250 [Chiua virens]